MCPTIDNPIFLSVREMATTLQMLHQDQLSLEQATSLAALVASSADGFLKLMQRRQRIKEVHTVAAARWHKAIHKVIVKNVVSGVRSMILKGTSSVSEWYRSHVNGDSCPFSPVMPGDTTATGQAAGGGGGGGGGYAGTLMFKRINSKRQLKRVGTANSKGKGKLGLVGISTAAGAAADGTPRYMQQRDRDISPHNVKQKRLSRIARRSFDSSYQQFDAGSGGGAAVSPNSTAHKTYADGTSMSPTFYGKGLFFGGRDDPDSSSNGNSVSVSATAHNVNTGKRQEHGSTVQGSDVDRVRNMAISTFFSGSGSAPSSPRGGATGRLERAASMRRPDHNNNSNNGDGNGDNNNSRQCGRSNGKDSSNSSAASRGSGKNSKGLERGVGVAAMKGSLPQINPTPKVVPYADVKGAVILGAREPTLPRQRANPSTQNEHAGIGSSHGKRGLHRKDTVTEGLAMHTHTGGSTGTDTSASGTVAGAGAGAGAGASGSGRSRSAGLRQGQDSSLRASSGDSMSSSAHRSRTSISSFSGNSSSTRGVEGDHRESSRRSSAGADSKGGAGNGISSAGHLPHLSASPAGEAEWSIHRTSDQPPGSADGRGTCVHRLSAPSAQSGQGPPLLQQHLEVNDVEGTQGHKGEEASSSMHMELLQTVICACEDGNATIGQSRSADSQQAGAADSPWKREIRQTTDRNDLMLAAEYPNYMQQQDLMMHEQRSMTRNHQQQLHRPQQPANHQGSISPVAEKSSMPHSVAAAQRKPLPAIDVDMDSTADDEFPARGHFWDLGQQLIADSVQSRTAQPSRRDPYFTSENQQHRTLFPGQRTPTGEAIANAHNIFQTCSLETEDTAAGTQFGGSGGGHVLVTTGRLKVGTSVGAGVGVLSGSSRSRSNSPPRGRAAGKAVGEEIIGGRSPASSNATTPTKKAPRQRQQQQQATQQVPQRNLHLKDTHNIRDKDGSSVSRGKTAAGGARRRVMSTSPARAPSAAPTTTTSTSTSTMNATVNKGGSLTPTGKSSVSKPDRVRGRGRGRSISPTSAGAGSSEVPSYTAGRRPHTSAAGLSNLQLHRPTENAASESVAGVRKELDGKEGLRDTARNNAFNTNSATYIYPTTGIATAEGGGVEKGSLFAAEQQGGLTVAPPSLTPSLMQSYAQSMIKMQQNLTVTAGAGGAAGGGDASSAASKDPGTSWGSSGSGSRIAVGSGTSAGTSVYDDGGGVGGSGGAGYPLRGSNILSGFAEPSGKSGRLSEKFASKHTIGKNLAPAGI